MSPSPGGAFGRREFCKDPLLKTKIVVPSKYIADDAQLHQTQNSWRRPLVRRNFFLLTAPAPAMELWQQLGYASFGEWRRSTEKLRRAAKKAARAALPATTTVRWQQLQDEEPLAQLRGRSNVAAPPSPPLVSGVLPGQLREDVLVTPQGRRIHRFKHTSPGGSTRFDEYVSPAGVLPRACEQRLECFRRLQVTRRAETRALTFACGECEACQEYARAYAFNGRKRVEEMAPAAMKRSRRHYNECERTLIL